VVAVAGISIILLGGRVRVRLVLEDRRRTAWTGWDQLQRLTIRGESTRYDSLSAEVVRRVV
jgi:hypothetical protein